MSHLKVELRSLRRNSLTGYEFDLTRFCACCWTKLGRITNSGARCPRCHRKVCKSCRHWSAKDKENTWICATCHNEISKRESGYQYLSRNGFKARKSCGTYSLRDPGINELPDAYVTQVKSRKHLKSPKSKKIQRIEIKSSLQNQRQIFPKGGSLKTVPCRDNPACIIQEKAVFEISPSQKEYSQVYPIQKWPLRTCVDGNIPQVPHKNSNLPATKHIPQCIHTAREEIKDTKQEISEENAFELKVNTTIIDQHSFNDFNCLSSRSSLKTIQTLSEQEFQLHRGIKSAPDHLKWALGDTSDETDSIDICDMNSINTEEHIKPRVFAIKEIFVNGEYNDNSFNQRNISVAENLNLRSEFKSSHESNSIVSTPITTSFERNNPRRRLSVREIRSHAMESEHSPSSKLLNKRLDYFDGMAFRPLTLRSISLPSTNLNLDDEYDPYVWHTGFVKARVRQIEEDLARNVRDFAASEWDVHSLVSLDTKRIAPDGNDYQLVYISSSAASQDSDVEEGDVHARHQSSFQSQIFSDPEATYPLSHGARDVSDWEMSTSNSTAVSSDDDSNFVPLALSKNASNPNSDNFFSEQNVLDIDSLFEFPRIESGLQDQMMKFFPPYSGTEKTGYFVDNQGSDSEKYTKTSIEQDNLSISSQRNLPDFNPLGDMLSETPLLSALHPSNARMLKSDVNTQNVGRKAHKLRSSKEENLKQERNENFFLISSPRGDDEIKSNRKKKLEVTQCTSKNVTCEKITTLTEGMNRETSADQKNSQYVIDSIKKKEPQNRNTKSFKILMPKTEVCYFTGEKNNALQEFNDFLRNHSHRMTDNFDGLLESKKNRQVCVLKTHPSWGQEGCASRNNFHFSGSKESTHALDPISHGHLFENKKTVEGSFANSKVKRKKWRKFLLYSHEIISDILVGQPHLLSTSLTINCMRMYLPIQIDVIHSNKNVITPVTWDKNYHGCPGARSCRSRHLKDEAYQEQNALFLDWECHGNERMVNAIVKSGNEKTAVKGRKNIYWHGTFARAIDLEEGSIFIGEDSLGKQSCSLFQGGLLLHLSQLTEAANTNIDHQETSRHVSGNPICTTALRFTPCNSVDTSDAAKTKTKRCQNISTGKNTLFKIKLQRQAVIKYVNLHYKGLNINSKFIIVRLMGANYIVSPPTSSKTSLLRNFRSFKNPDFSKIYSYLSNTGHDPYLERCRMTYYPSLNIYEERSRLFLDVSPITRAIVECCVESLKDNYSLRKKAKKEGHYGRIHSCLIENESLEKASGHLTSAESFLENKCSPCGIIKSRFISKLKRKSTSSCGERLSPSIAAYYSFPSSCSSLIANASPKSPSLVWLSRKPKPTLQSRCSDTPEEIHNSQCRMADVSSTTGESPAPETRVIDTRRDPTSETCSAALCSPGTDLEGKRRLFPRPVVTVPADPRVTKRGGRTPSPFEDAACASAVPRAPLSNSAVDSTERLPCNAEKGILGCSSVCTVDYPYDGARTVGNYHCQNVDMCDPTVVREVISSGYPSADYLHVTLKEVQNCRLVPAKRGMSVDESFSYDGSNSKIRGGKVSQLKKFFDSGAEHLPCCNTKRDRISGSACVDESIDSDSGMETYLDQDVREKIFSATGIPCCRAISNYVEQETDLCREANCLQNDSCSLAGEVTKHETVCNVDNYSSSLNVNNELIQGDIVNAVVHEHDCPTGSVMKNQNEAHNSRNTSIPFREKSGCLWDTQDLSRRKMEENEILRNHANSFCSTRLFDKSEDFTNSPTSKLNNLIIKSRAELSKIEPPSELKSKSTLENYFTYGLDFNEPSKFHGNSSDSESGSCRQQRIDDEKHSRISQNITYNCSDLDNSSFEDKGCLRNGDLDCACDADEMYDDLDALSDLSDDEDEARFLTLSSSTHYSQPSYTLHTIIEESCEESERDSRSSTPTNNEPTSKLHQYFSWGIINDPVLNTSDVDDSSTVFSDSLSENSDVLNAEKETESPCLISSRLEKYFTSGLLGNDEHFYSDVEYADDASVSDFEGENSHHKISRSALLSSLESGQSHLHDSVDIKHVQNNPSFEQKVTETIHDGESSSETSHKSNTSQDIKVKSEDSDYGLIMTSNDRTINADSVVDKPNCSMGQANEVSVEKLNDCTIHDPLIPCNEISDVNMVIDVAVEHSSIDFINKNAGYIETSAAHFEKSEMEVDLPLELQSMKTSVNVVSKKAVDKKSDCNDINENFDDNAQAIMKKIIIHLSDNLSHSSGQSTEFGYVSAWKILETEIERLMQSVSPLSAVENYNSCNSSTIGSSNSDYGSDTIDSTECLTTDEDDNCLDGRSNYLNTYNNAQKSTLHKVICESNFNGILCISDETLEIWKKLMLSLKRDKLSLLRNNNDEYTRARVYIQDQIIALMHTVTTNHTVSTPEEEIAPALSAPCSSYPIEEYKQSDYENVLEESKETTTDLNHTINQIVMNKQSIKVDCFHSSVLDEGISVDSTEHFNYNLRDSVLQHKNSLMDNLHCSNHCDLDAADESFHKLMCTSCEISSTEYTEIFAEIPDLMKQKIPVTDVLISGMENVNDETEKLSVSSDTLNTKKSEVLTDNVDESHHSSIYVDIHLSDKKSTVTERNVGEDSNDLKSCLHHVIIGSELNLSSEDNYRSDKIENSGHFTSHELQSSGRNLNSPKEKFECELPLKLDNQCYPENKSQEIIKTSHNAHRDTGYYSFRSSDDSILSMAGSHREHPECTTKQDSIEIDNSDDGKSTCIPEDNMDNMATNGLSLSYCNISQNLSNMEDKFYTLQPKSSVSKVSMNPKPNAFGSGTSRPLATFFSPSAVFKRLTSTKSYGTPSEISIPSKYIKKYGRSSSVDDESLFGARSMPHLNSSNLVEAHSFASSNRGSCLTLNDDMAEKHSFSNCGQSVFSLGSHSASMTSVYSAAGGRHFGYISVSGDVLFGLNYNQKSQMMEVFVKQCRNLAAVDPKRNKSDPYVKVYLLPDKTKSGKRKTKTKKNSLNPVFNELLRFPVLKHELESRTLWLSVWNSDLFGRNDFLGEIMLALGYRLLDSPTLRWYPLQERMESLTSPLKYKGELFLALKYVPKDLSLESRFRPAPVISLKGALHVLVKEARNIAATRSNGTSDPFCKSYLLPDKTKNSKQKTPVVKKTQHPKWYYTVIYEDLSVDELKERSLELTLWDRDKITSNEFMGGVRLNCGTGLYHGIPVEWMDSHRDETTLWQAMLERPNMWVDGSLPLRPTMQFVRN